MAAVSHFHKACLDMNPARHIGPYLLYLVLPILPAVPADAQDDARLLNRVFQDQVVLQRDTAINVWGTAPAGDTIRVMMAGQTARARADDDGSWSAQLSSLDAGGPHRLIARSSSGRVQVLEDVLIGDVFLCSGQSNMELSVQRTLNAPTEISNASNDRIRMLTVPHAHSATPEQTLPTPLDWETASPETVSEWSATCYYFARTLQNHVDVPLGLLHSAWGGTSITAWMSAEALSSVGGYEHSLSLLTQYQKDRQTAQHTFGTTWENWWHHATEDRASDAPWHPEAGEQWAQAPEGLGDWKEWETPELANFQGMVWHRTTIQLTAEEASRDAVLSLGAIDAVDQTWINGNVVGNTFGWGTDRTYAIPAEDLREGTNVIVVNVLNTWGQGGMLGPPSSRTLLSSTGERLPLTSWQYKKGASDIGTPPSPPWEPVSGLSTLHNAMVAPVHQYSLRGVLWYQGESDTDKGFEYFALLQALKEQWREQFGENLPVLVVQLANYGARSTTPEKSNWAKVRDAQRRATQSDPNAGLAVTIDIGSPYDIHPANKQEVGRRLTRASRHIIYEADIPPSGPTPVRATHRSDGVVVEFEAMEDTLVAYSHDAPIGFELCGTNEQSCTYVDAQIDGDRVRLDATEVHQPARVRYCWADSPVCTLYDDSGLPTTPFEINIANGESDE